MPTGTGGQLTHDPQICGLGLDCDTCNAARGGELREFYRRDAEARERAQRRDIARRLDELGIGINDLAAALLPELAAGIAQIVVALIDDRKVQHDS